jgi:hypothetical protein
VGEVEFIVGVVKPVVDVIDFGFKLVEAPVYSFEPLVNLSKPLVDLIKSLVDRGKAPVNFDILSRGD